MRNIRFAISDPYMGSLEKKVWNFFHDLVSYDVRNRVELNVEGEVDERVAWVIITSIRESLQDV